jgi:Ca2+-binding RTX toxin-like protein
MAIQFGNSSADFLIGSADPNSLFGLGGDDSLFGLGGDDLLAGDAGDDLLEGDAPPANVRFVAPIGDPGDDTLIGGHGNDTLIGGAGSDLLLGGSGNDVLDGGFSFGHMDTLVGGAGQDVLSGGGGVDTFLFFDGDLPADRARPDLITDFQTAAIVNIIADYDFIQFDTATDSGLLTSLGQQGDTTTYLVKDGDGRDLGFLAVTTVGALPLVEGADYVFV